MKPLDLAAAGLGVVCFVAGALLPAAQMPLFMAGSSLLGLSLPRPSTMRKSQVSSLKDEKKP